MKNKKGAWGSTHRSQTKPGPSKTRRPVTTLLATGEPLQFLPASSPAVNGYEKVRRREGIEPPRGHNPARARHIGAHRLPTSKQCQGKPASVHTRAITEAEVTGVSKGAHARRRQLPGNRLAPMAPNSQTSSSHTGQLQVTGLQPTATENPLKPRPPEGSRGLEQGLPAGGNLSQVNSRRRALAGSPPPSRSVVGQGGMDCHSPGLPGGVEGVGEPAADLQASQQGSVTWSSEHD